MGRRLSERLGGAGGRGCGERDARLEATGLAAEEMQRESARPTARGQVEEPWVRRVATEGVQAAVPKQGVLQLRQRHVQMKRLRSKPDCRMRTTRAVWLRPNVRANRPAVAGPLVQRGVRPHLKISSFPELVPELVSSP